MRGAWIGALGGAVVAGAAGATVAGTRRYRSRRHAAADPDSSASSGPGSATTSPDLVGPPGLPAWTDSPGRIVTTEDGLRSGRRVHAGLRARLRAQPPVLALPAA